MHRKMPGEKRNRQNTLIYRLRLYKLYYKRPLSYPVGYITYADMYPLNFKEFLWAVGIQENVIKALHQMFLEGTQVPEAMHSKMMQYLQ